jgi:hypothetical protein
MLIHEQIYTSASELLSPTQSDLGVVAESVGFPSKIAAQLMTLASYRILQGLPIDDPAIHPSRIVAMPRNDGTSYSVSRVVYAGADHSGRTTPLAHHVLIALDELKKADLQLADTIGVFCDHFVDTWDQPPRRFDPPRTIEVTPTQRPMDSIGKADSHRIANVTGWLAARFVDGLENSSFVVFVLPADQRDAALKLLAVIQRAIESTNQSSLVFQSHISSSSDLIGNAHVVATYPNSEYLSEIKSRPEKRRPPIVDFCIPLENPFNNVGFARWFEREHADGDCRTTLQDGLLLRKSLNDIDESKYPDGFSQLWEFYELYRNGSLIAQSDAVGLRIRGLSEISPMVKTFVTDRIKEAINDHFRKMQGKSDWKCFLKILIDDSWPSQARSMCLEAITKMHAIAFPIAIANHEALKIPKLVQNIDATIETNPNDWRTWLQGAPQLAANSRSYLENRIASGKLSFKAAQQVTEMLIATGNIDQQKQSVINFLNIQNYGRPIPVSHLDWLQSIEPESGLLKKVLELPNLPQQIAESLKAFLDPHPPTPPVTHPPTSSLGEIGLMPPHFQNVAAPPIKTRIDHSKTRRIQDPRKKIVMAEVFTGVVVIMGASFMVFGDKLKIPNLSKQMAWSAVAAAVISMLIGLVVYFWFSGNRSVARQRHLMIFGFLSFYFMVSTSIFVIASFVAPFFWR